MIGSRGDAALTKRIPQKRCIDTQDGDADLGFQRLGNGDHAHVGAALHDRIEPIVLGGQQFQHGSLLRFVWNVRDVLRMSTGESKRCNDIETKITEHLRRRLDAGPFKGSNQADPFRAVTVEPGLGCVVPSCPREIAEFLDLCCCFANRLDASDDVLKAHAHDEILRTGQQRAVHRICNPTEEVLPELLDGFGRTHVRLGCEHRAGVQTNAVEPVVSVPNQNVPKFTLHRGVGGGSEQSETTPVIACIGVARRELCNIKKGRGFAVVQRTGRRNRWHWRAIHIWNEHGAAGEWPGDCFATARCHGLSGILPRAAGGLRARSDCRTEHCRSTTCDGRAAGDQTGFVR